MPSLVDTSSQRRFTLGDLTSIGRAAGSGVRLEDPMVSAVHAEIAKLGDGTFRIRDLGSRAGTYLGRTRILESALRDGDELLIGPVRLRFQADESAHDAEELRKLRAIVELSRAIGVEHDLDRLLARVLETCFQLLRADRGMMIVYAPGSTVPTATCTRSRSGEIVPEVLSTSVLSQIMETREPYLRTEIDSDLALKRSESLSANGIRSLVAVPLLYQGTEWLGVIHVDSRAATNVFTPRDLELLSAIAGQAVLAIKNAMLVRQLQNVRSAEWQRLDRIVTNLPVGVVVLDDEHRCLVANEWITRRAGCIGTVTPGTVIDQIAGVSCDLLVGTDVHQQVVCGERELTFVIDARTSADGREAVVVISDITEERAQQTKAAHQDRLALIGQLAGGIAHDFNNLLCVIVNYASLLEDSVIGDAKADAAVIHQTATSATELVRQLLAFSRRESVKPRVIDVVAAVTAMEPMLHPALGSSIAVTIETPPTPQPILLDPSQLEQIIMNLAVNARDAMASRGTLAIRVIAEASSVVVEVTDTGSGMTKDVAARIFEPYFTTKPVGKGTGLGLATVHGIVEHAGGSIAVTSELGRGTTFRVSLPRTELEAKRAEPEREVSRGRVLVVDDDHQIRRVTERMLSHAGYTVSSATSGLDALAVLAKEPFDILLTDMVMPGMTGRDLARTVASEYPHIRIIFMSGYHAGTPIPASQFIAKPFARKTLLDMVEQAAALAPDRRVTTTGR